MDKHAVAPVSEIPPDTRKLVTVRLILRLRDQLGQRVGREARMRHDRERRRKRIEEVFGWIKSSAGLAKVKLRGRDRVDAAFTLALAAYNLIRLPKLLGAAT